MARSVSPLLLLVLVLLTLSAAALGIRPGGGEGEALAKACDGTATLKECVGVLNSNPDGLAPRRLAELAYTFLVKDAGLLHNETAAAVDAAPAEDLAMRGCGAVIKPQTQFYYDSVSRFALEQSEEKFAQAKGNLDELIGELYNFSIRCAAKAGESFVRKTADYQDMLRTMKGIMERAAEDPKKKEAAPK